MTNKKNKTIKLRLVHINDTHSHFEPTSLQLEISTQEKKLTPFVSAGGFARIKTRVNQLRQNALQNEQAFIFLHAGDCFQGTLYFSLFKGEANATMLNALGIDAMALGNHELDMGNAPVARFAKRIEFPLLAGNWDLSKECEDKRELLSDNPTVLSYNPEKQAAQWITKPVGDDYVAIFSLAIDKMEEISNPDIDTPFIDAIETAKKTIEQINQAGINNIILLSHMGYEADLEFPTHVDGISVIVGGHSHRLQGDFSGLGLKKDDPYGVKVNDTYIVQSGCNSLSVGYCDLEFGSKGKLVAFDGKNELLLGRSLFVDAKLQNLHNGSAYEIAKHYIHQHPNVSVCAKDKTLQSVLEDKYTCQVRKLQKEYIAESDRKLRHIRVPDIEGPSQLAPIVAKSFFHKMRKLGHKVDFAIHNAGGVRTSLNAGKISVADIAGRLLPFEVPIGVYHIKGKFLPLILEGAINNATNNGIKGTGDGSYPYAYNLGFDYLRDEELGQRVKNLKFFDGNSWRTVQNEKVYIGTSSAYTMKGKEGYEAILNMEGEGTITNSSMADCFIELLTDHPETLNYNNAEVFNF
jgi:5'-nucleotidase